MNDHPDVTLFLNVRSVESGWSRRTRDAYGRDLALFTEFLASCGQDDPSRADASQIMRFLEDRERAGDGEATLNRRLAALRSFFGFLENESALRRPITEHLPSPKRTRSLPKALSEAEMGRLLATCGGTGVIDRRDRAALELLYAAGIRASELCGLQTAHLIEGSKHRPRLRVLGKGEKERIVPLHDEAVRRLDVYRNEARPRLFEAAAARGEVPTALFLGARGGPLTRRALYHRVRLRARQAGIARPVGPHTLRHTFATHLVHGGADLRSVQELLGHASIGTTQVYTAVDGARLRDIHEKFHPRG